MTTLAIKDLLLIEELDHVQMDKVLGGSLASRLDNPLFISIRDVLINAGYLPEDEE